MTSIIEKLAEETGFELRRRKLKLATAESCTGGGLSYWVTSIPGSSEWFERGFVTYSDAAKSEMLGVSPHTLETFGAVSEETVREMAEGALHKSPADVSIAITGIAGPAGGSLQKPVGTVWMAWAKRHGFIQTQMEIFPGKRSEIREQTIITSLKKLLELIKTEK